jgi:4'-phosphopantetheinyl transferase
MCGLKMPKSLQWLTQDLSEIPESEDWLSEGERSRLAGMRFPKRRNDWKLGRWTAKRTIRACRPCDVSRDSALEIRSAVDGAPEPYLNGEPLNISISISHSRERSLCAVGPGDFRIGCDLEFLEPRENIFLQDYFTQEECAFVEQVGSQDKALVSMLVWSAKESALKILREGLRRDTRSISIRPDLSAREGNWKPWTGYCLQSSSTFHGWWRMLDGYIYTMASDQFTALPDQLSASFGS